MREERRYKTTRWRKVRLIVLRRDNYSCWVLNCPRHANHCDHIDPVYPLMPASEFYGLHNLRASCFQHNTKRGVAARLEREMAEGVAPLPRRSVYAERSRSFKTTSEQDRRLPKSLSLTPYSTVTADYSRREPTDGVG